MRKTIASILGAAVLLAPASSLAIFQSPSSLLMSIGYDGKPQEFENSFYARVEIPETFVIKGDIKGAIEGKTLSNMKLKMDAYASAAIDENDRMSLSIKTILHMKKFYVRIDGLKIAMSELSRYDLANLDREIQKYVGKWYSIDLTDLDDSAFALHDIDSTLKMYGEIFEEMNMTPEEIKKFIMDVIDAVFTMERNQFKDGFAYTLTLKPDFLERAFEVTYNMMKECGCESYFSDAGIDIFQKLLGNAMNLKMKIDTNALDQFRFSKTYFSLNMDNEVEIAIEGKNQHRPKPVYLDVPYNALSLEDAIGELLGAEAFFGGVFEGIEEGEDDWILEEEEEIEGEYDWEGDLYRDGKEYFEPEEETTVPFMESEVRREQLPQYVQEDCAYMPLDASYVGLIRKGNCQIHRYSKRTINEALRDKAKLNPHPRLPISPALQNEEPQSMNVVPRNLGNERVYGNANAGIIVVEYSDFECPFCRTHFETMKNIVEEYDGKVGWVLRHYPLYFHENAPYYSQAAECAFDQKGNSAFWEYAELLFQEDTSKSSLRTYARQLGLDTIEFNSCLREDSGFKISSDIRTGGYAGITGVPWSSVINMKTGKSKTVSGAVPMEEMRRVIDGLLE